MKPRAILFDMDGVLVDTSQSFDQAILRTLETYGASSTIAEIYAYRQKGGFNNDWVLTERLLLDRDIACSFDEIKQRFMGIYFGEPKGTGLIATETWLLRRDVLQSLAGAYSLGIVTGRNGMEAEWAYSRSGVADFFQAIVTDDDVKKSKPDPEGIRMALLQLGGPEATYLGDSVDDCRAAQAAGIGFIGVIPPGHRNPDSLRAAFGALGVKRLFTDINQVTELLNAPR